MTIPEWTERRIGSILSAPRMWGSLEAVEAQVITLCEVRQVALTGSPVCSGAGECPGCGELWCECETNWLDWYRTAGSTISTRD